LHVYLLTDCFVMMTYAISQSRSQSGNPMTLSPHAVPKINHDLNFISRIACMIMMLWMVSMHMALDFYAPKQSKKPTNNAFCCVLQCYFVIFTGK